MRMRALAVAAAVVGTLITATPAQAETGAFEDGAARP